jgi:GT2 family glycosyltransferase
MESNTPKCRKLFWGSSYDRGLDIILYLWPDILAAYPDAELHVTYGWNLFNIAMQNNPERQEWKRSMDVLLNQKGITHYGRVGKEELAKIRKECGIWAYPTYFEEINCITALECQADGVVPVTMALAALKETVKEGVLVSGDIREDEVRKDYLQKLLKLMGDRERWNKLSIKCKKLMKRYYWSSIADKWIDFFEEPVSKPTVSVITPTIREGWWRIMSENLSKQTYKIHEWVILDDYKEDRSEIAEKYAKKYGLNIIYVHGDKAKGDYKRKCGLVRANNKGWQTASGELLVWLQDFILIPTDGIERLVDVYRHNPDALIAPVDVYYDCKTPDTKNKEDWWKAQNQWGYYSPVLTKEIWKNIRVENKGLRESDNPFDYEANYGAIPRKILVELNGWWEFMDDGLGYDNTEIAYRALKLGYRIIIDDTNICSCINLWPIIGGLSQNITSRERMLNPPRWNWLARKTDAGELPIKRDQKLDDSITLTFKVPDDIEDKDCADWINDHTEEIIKEWQ